MKIGDGVCASSTKQYGRIVRNKPLINMRVDDYAPGSCELAQILIAGVEHEYAEVDERYRVLIAIVERLRRARGGLDYAADHIKAHIRDDRDACLSAGVCPYCGEDVTVAEGREHHPTPFGAGTVAEVTRGYVCSMCGEI